MLTSHMQGDHAAAVTPSDTDTFTPSIVQCGGAGTVNITDAFGANTQYTVVAGGVVPVLCTKVRTGGTATAIVRSW